MDFFRNILCDDEVTDNEGGNCRTLLQIMFSTKTARTAFLSEKWIM